MNSCLAEGRPEEDDGQSTRYEWETESEDLFLRVPQPVEEAPHEKGHVHEGDHFEDSYGFEVREEKDLAEDREDQLLQRIEADVLRVLLGRRQ